MQVRAIRTRRFKPGDGLVSFIKRFLQNVRNGDVIVVTSKIVALAQGRVVSLDRRGKDYWIRRESRKRIKTPWCWITFRDGEWCANAGVDESNAAGGLILLPRDPDASARRLWQSLRRSYGVRQLGVILTDTRIMPLSQGVRGVALSYAGFRGLRDLRGSRDLYGRPLKMTVVNVADALATAAVFNMGEGKESRPLALIRGAGVSFTNRRTPHTLLRIRPEDDVYRWLYLKTARVFRGARIRHRAR